MEGFGVGEQSSTAGPLLTGIALSFENTNQVI